MPWCEPCERYYAPSAMTPEGHCPACDNDLLAPDPEPSAADGVPTGSGDGDSEKVPWHFKLMILALVVYLGYRFVELGVKLFT